MAFLYFFLSHSAFAITAGSQTITVDGRLFTSLTSDTPLLDSSVVLDIKIYNPALSCILYEEKQTVDTSSTDGRFTINIGSAVGASKRVSGEPGNPMTAVFQNVSAIAGSCGAYTPTAGDVRYVRITVAPSTTGTIEVLSPDTIIDQVPNALVAETLQGLSSTNFVQTDTASLTQSNVANIFSATNYPLLTALLGGTSSSYVTSSTSGAKIPTVAGVPTSLAQGQIWFNSSANAFQYYNGSAVQTLGISGSGIAALTVGNSLTANGVTGGTLNSSGTIDLVNSGVASGSYPKVTVNSKGLVTYGTGLVESDIPTLSTPGHVVGDAIISGTIGGNTAFYSSGNVTSAGTVSGLYVTSTYDRTRKLTIFGTGGSNSISLTAPTMSTDYAVVFPASQGAAGTVLVNDGSGNLSWAASSSGSVTSVGLALPSIFSVTTPLVTSTGTLTAALVSQNANMIFAGPSSGAAGVPTFRGLAVADLPAGYDASVQKNALATGQIWVGNSSGVAAAVTPFGDINLSIAGSATVTQLQGRPVMAGLPTGAGQVLRWTGAAWAPNFLAMSDLRSTITGAQSLSSCATNQTLTFNSATDSLMCASISIANTQVAWGSTGANLVFAGPASGGSAAPAFRSLAAADLPPGIATQWNTVSTTINYLAGFVGIGTATPQAKLDVFGTGASSAMLVPRDVQAARPTGINGMLRYNTSSNAMETYANGSWTTLATASSGASQWTTSGSSIYYGTGNVGVGSSAPVNALDVSTNADVQGWMAVGGTAQAETSASNPILSVYGNLDIVGPGNALVFYNGGGRTFINSAGLTANAGSVQTFDFSNSNGMSVGVNTTSNASNLDVAGNAAFGSYGGVTAAPANGLIVSGSVGVGTATPQATLDVYGTASASAMLVPRDTTSARPTGVNGMVRYNTSLNSVETYANGAWSTVATSASGASQWTTNGSSIYYGSGNVGIGMNSPSRKLAVVGLGENGAPTDAGSKAATILVGSGYGALNDGGSIEFGAGVGAYAQPYFASIKGQLSDYNSNTAGDLLFYLRSTNSATGLSEKMRITSSGNVGIGTASPQWPLDVVGQIQVSNKINTPHLGTNGGTLLIDTASNNSDIIFGNSYVYMKTGGKVGVGTSAPQALFDVYGTASNSAMLVPRDATAARPTGVNGMLRYNTDLAKLETYSSGAWNSLVTSAAGGGSSQWTSNGANIYYSTGNVGIGSSVPTQALDVSANVNVGGTIYGSALTTNAGVNLNLTTGAAPGTNANGNTVNITGGIAGTTYGYGGAVNITGGYGYNGYPGGAVNISGGPTTFSNSSGSAVVIKGGSPTGTGLGGPVSILASNAAGSGYGGSLSLFAGNGVGFPGGNAYLGAGNATTNNTTGGSLYLTGGNANGTNMPGGNIIIAGGTGTGTGATGYILTSGSVGIGTTAPGAILDINGSGTVNSAVIVPRDSTAARPTAAVNGMIRYNTTSAQLETYTSGAWMGLATNATNGGASQWTTSGSTIYYVASSGMVGIGTPSPYNTLDVRNTVNTTSYASSAMFGVTNNVAGSNYSRILLGQVSTNASFVEAADQSNTKGTLLLQPYGGGVGIGTTLTSSLLNVGGSTGTNTTRQTIQINEGGIATPSADGAYSYGDKLIMWNALGTVKNSIGNDSYGLWLQSSASTYSHIGFWTGPTSGTAPLERMRVDSAGNVGIGTNSPTALLDMRGISTSSPVAHTITNTAGGANGTAALIVSNYGSGSSFVQLNQARGTMSSPSATQAGDTLGFLQMQGYGASANSGGTAIVSYAEANYTNSSGAGAMAFSTTPSSSATSLERMRITGSGTVGIGTNSPTSLLTLNAGANDGLRINNGTVNGVVFNNSNSNMTVGTVSSHPLLLFTGNTTRATLDTSGNLGVGVTPSYRLHVSDSQSSGFVADFANTANSGGPSGIVIAAGVTGSASGAALIQFKDPSGNNMGSITQTGATSISYNTSSDRRLKENIVPTSRGLDEVLRIPIYDFNFIADPSKTRVQGYIAQEMRSVYPEAVHVGGEDPKKDSWSVDYGRLTPLLVSAIKEFFARWMTDSAELHHRIDELEKANAIKDAEIKALRDRQATQDAEMLRRLEQLEKRMPADSK